MYVPPKLAMRDETQIRQLIEANGFGTLLSADLQASHLPFLCVQKAEGLQLLSHMARANPHWRELDGQDVMIIFQGPHAYISPRWYAAAPAVPTWNYAAVHLYGTLSLCDAEETLRIVNQTVEKYEADLIGDAVYDVAEYKQKLAAAIVGFRIDISKVEAKQKLGQHRSQADQQGVVRGLLDAGETDLVDYMRTTGVGLGK